MLAKGRRNVASGAVWQPVLGTIKWWEFGFGDSDILCMQLTRDVNYFSLGLCQIQKSPPVTIVLARAWLPSGSSADPMGGWGQGQGWQGCAARRHHTPRFSWPTVRYRVSAGTFTVGWTFVKMDHWILLVLPAKINKVIFLKTGQTEISSATPLLSYSSDMFC